MLSFKRFLYIVLVVAALGGIFLIYTVNGSRPASAPARIAPVPEREFTETRQIGQGEKPRVWILGDSGDTRCGEICRNVRQLCQDLHLTVAGEGYPDAGRIEAEDVIIFCDPSVSRYGDLAELEGFLAGGGRVILAAGLEEGEEHSGLWPLVGIRKMSQGEDCRNLVFEKPLLPIQPERASWNQSSGSARIDVSADASVYIRDEDSGVPILYTYTWQKGSVCLINGNFLADSRCMGLLTGAMGALLPDFIYPVLGVKAVFLDNFPADTSAHDQLCRQMYGYSAEGFVREVVWPALQGISLRTGTPYTLSISTEGGESFTAVAKSVLQLGGELADPAGRGEDGALSSGAPDAPGGDTRSVRGLLESRDTRFSWEDGLTVFPAATRGNSMEDGNLFAVCSVLGAYGMVSHVFDVNMLMVGEGNTAAWDSEKKQISLFESEVLARTPWLEGRTLSQTGPDVRSYQDMDYGWTKSGSSIELNCSGTVKGQAFFYHTDIPIAGAAGLTYEEAGNGYYLLRIQENHGIITLEEEK